MREALKKKTERALAIFNELDRLYPDVSTFLDHQSSFQLLVAVILSAQCTDERVNMVTPGLFSAYPDALSLSKADHFHVEKLIGSINYFRSKSANIIKTATLIMTHFNGDVPSTLDELITLPGVGRKTANVMLGQAFGQPGITVDTHVRRLVHRMGFSKKEKTADAIEFDLMKVWPKNIWTDMSTVLIMHGRQICNARSPKCDQCAIIDHCPAKDVTP